MTAFAFLVGCLCALLGLIVLVLRSVDRARLWPPVLLIVTAPLEVYRTNLGAANLSLFRLALIVVLAHLAYRVVRRQADPWTRAASLVAYACFVLWQLVSLAAVSTQPSLAYRLVAQWGAGLVAVWAIGRYAKRSDLPVLAVSYVAAAALPLASCVYRVFSFHNGGSGSLPGLSLLPVDSAILGARQTGSFLTDGTQRMQATFADPNHFGFFVATALLVALGLLAANVQPLRRMRAGLAALAALACLIGLIGSYSRSAWILTAIGCVCLLLLLGRSIWTPKRLAVAALVVVAGAAVTAPTVLNRVNPSNHSTQISDSVHKRTMRIAIDLVGSHPIVGVGLGSYGQHARQPKLVSSAHSTILTVAAELGIPGLLLLLAAMSLTAYGGIRGARALPPPDRFLAAALPATYGAMAIANIFYEVWDDDFQWMLFALVLWGLAHVELPEWAPRGLPLSRFIGPRPRSMR